MNNIYMNFFSDNSNNWVSFYFAIPHSYQSQVLKTLEPLFNSYYLITQEVSTTSHKDTSGEHYHVMFIGNDIQYRKCITNLKKFYSLSGQARDGHARQYGKVRDLRDPFRMGAYILKQSMFQHTNFPSEIISRLEEASFEKPTINSNSERDEIMEYLDQHIDLDKPTEVTQLINHSYYETPRQVKIAIIDYHVQHPEIKFLTTHRLKYLCQYYLMYHRKILKPEELYSFFYN